MPRPSPTSMNDIIREDQNKKQQDFLRNTEEFPCLFNLGKCKLDIGSRKYKGNELRVLDVPKNMWQFLKDDLNNDSEVSEWDMEVWKDNLLTYVYAELGMYKDAFELNKAVQDQHGKSNLIALVNAAFLFYKTGNLSEAYRILDDLKKLKSQQSFVDLKIDAICELGYAFRKLGGAKNLQFSISLLEFALLFCPCNEQIQLMLGIVWRRCCHFNIYSTDPENINLHDFALKAAKSLFKLGTTSKDTSFKAAALIELAYLKYQDDPHKDRNYNCQHILLSPEEWFQIVQDRSWKQFCDEATAVCADGPSEKVLKMAGQLYRYHGTDESLKKSEWLLKWAIAKKSSNRAHHHLGLTYRKMAVSHEQKYNMSKNNFKNTQNTFGRCNVRSGREYTPNGFSNYRETFDGSREHTIHGREFKNNPMGRYTSSSVEKTPEEFVNSTIRMRHTSRGFQQQGLNYRHERNAHQENFNQHTEYMTEGAEGPGLQVLPEPPVNSTPKIPEKQLKCMIKVPDQFKPFSKDNPHVDKAIHHLQQAVDISHHQNKVALYDLACILVQAENYEKSKEVCKILIEECISSKTVTSNPVSLVNAYNLYGICCAKEAEAEVDQLKKKQLEDESEEYLTLAVRLASYLASTVPELEMCATDLWKAFRTLEKKFKFQGQKDSRDKLYRLCEWISDYRYLEAVDEICEKDPEELKKIEIIEQCLQRYLNMKAYDSALLFRDLIILQPEVKAKLCESKVYKQLMLEVAEGKLEKMCLERNHEAYHPDPAWKQLFSDEFRVTGHSKSYDIVIVSDVDDDYELKRGMMYDISKHLKRVLLETFGLNVVRAHKECVHGCAYLEEQLHIINNSRVSLFVLTDPCIDSLSLVSEVAGLRISESENPVPKSGAMNKERNDSSIREGALTSRECANQNSLSQVYERIINASLCSFLKNIGATRMIIVIPDNLKLEDLPLAVRGLPNITLSLSEIEILTASGSGNEQYINLMKKIFRAVLGNSQEQI